MKYPLADAVIGTIIQAAVWINRSHFIALLAHTKFSDFNNGSHPLTRKFLIYPQFMALFRRIKIPDNPKYISPHKLHLNNP